MKRKIVMVEWVDSAAVHGWCGADEVDPAPHVIRSIGFVVRKDDESITLSTSDNGQGRFVDPLTIPLCCVKSIKNVKP